MRNLIAFTKKEFLEQIRTKKIIILGMLFLFFGILNPLTAKLTPMILEMLSESMENSGIVITTAEITALDSWMQFFKNLPVVLIVFVLMESTAFSKEYQSGTLTLVLTKGFERYKVVVSKIVVMVLLWTFGYLVYFAVTYLYNEYFWDNSIASNLFFSVLSWWIFGVFVISIFILVSVNFESNGSALALTGLVVFGLYFISFIPKLIRYLPIVLTDGNSLTYGIESINYYIPGLVITICLIAIVIIFSVIRFNKKKI